MNLKTILGLLVRHALTLAAGGLIAKGYVEPDQAAQLADHGAAFVMAGGAVGWSWLQKHQMFKRLGFGG